MPAKAQKTKKSKKPQSRLASQTKNQPLPRFNLGKRLIHNLLGRQLDTHGDSLILTRLFQSIKLTLQQRRIEEMPGPRLQPLLQNLLRTLEINKAHIAIPIAQHIAIRTLQRRAGEHGRLTRPLLFFDRRTDRPE